MYYKKRGVIVHKSLCVISDVHSHDTLAVYIILQKLIPILKTLIPRLAKIHYFSDGAASQYKNKTMFLNLYHHHQDFKIKAIWNFFATSHGKSPCDGIGGCIKYLARRASLQRPSDQQILTPRQLYDFASLEIQNVEILWMGEDDRKEFTALHAERDAAAKTINGTRSHHQYVPKEDGISLYRVSGDSAGTFHRIRSAQPTPNCELHPGNYVACIYDQHWYVGCVTMVGEDDFGEVEVSFMEVAEFECAYRYPRRSDICWVPKGDILDQLQLTTQNHRTYVAKADDLDRIHHIYQQVCD